MKSFLLSFLFVPFFASAIDLMPPPETNCPPYSNSISLSWISTDTNATAYNIYIGTNSGHYFTSNLVGTLSTASPLSAQTNTIIILTNEARYFFAVTSIDTNGDESPMSDEIQFPPPITSVAMLSVSVLSSTNFGASWQTEFSFATNYTNPIGTKLFRCGPLRMIETNFLTLQPTSPRGPDLSGLNVFNPSTNQ